MEIRSFTMKSELICCIFGQPKIYNKQEVEKQLRSKIEFLIQEGVYFYFMTRIGEFEELAYQVCNELKKKHNKIQIFRFFCNQESMIQTQQTSPSYNDLDTSLTFISSNLTIKDVYLYMIKNSQVTLAYITHCKKSPAYYALKFTKKYNIPTYFIHDKKMPI